MSKKKDAKKENPPTPPRGMIDFTDLEQLRDRYLELLKEPREEGSLLERVMRCRCGKGITCRGLRVMQALAGEMIADHLPEGEEACAEAVGRALVMAGFAQLFDGLGANAGPTIAEIVEEVFVAVAGASISAHVKEKMGQENKISAPGGES